MMQVKEKEAKNPTAALNATPVDVSPYSKNGIQSATDKGLGSDFTANDNTIPAFAPGKINYIRALNVLWQELPFIDGYRGIYALIALAIIDSINRNGWRRVSLPLDYLLNKCGCCRKVYTDARNWLDKNQIIKVVPGKNANQMAVFDIGLAVHIWTSRVTTTEAGIYTPDTYLDDQIRTGKGTHYKTVNKNKPKTLNIEFDVWFLLYDKNFSEKACKKLWSKLTDEERIIALEHTPKYVESTPDLKYRQNPKRYLEEKTFNSPIILQQKSKNHSAILKQKEYGQREPI